MATTIELLPKEQREMFDKPPKFTKADRAVYFHFEKPVQKYISTIQSPNNKICFIVNYGYFRARGRFFEPGNFKRVDIDYIRAAYGFTPKTKNLTPDKYNAIFGGASATRYKKKILELESWTPLNDDITTSLSNLSKFHAEKMLSPEKHLAVLTSHLWKEKIVTPAYDYFAKMISQSNDYVEQRLINIVKDKISDESKELFDTLLKNKAKRRSPLNQLKTIDESLRARRLDASAKKSDFLMNIFLDNQELIDALHLHDEAIAYFGNQVIRFDISQLTQFKDKSKIYLRLIAFVVQQFSRQQDALLTGYRKTIKALINKVNKSLNDSELALSAQRNKSIDASTDKLRLLSTCVDKISNIVHDDTLSEPVKIVMIGNCIAQVEGEKNGDFDKKIDFLEKLREKEKSGETYFNHLEKHSKALQLKAGPVIKSLVFDDEYCDVNVLEAVNHYRKTNGSIGKNPPTAFLTKKEKSAAFKDDKFHTSLYKALLFIAVFEKSKSMEMPLKYGFKYRALEKYLIDSKYWEENKDDLIKNAGLTQYLYPEEYLDTVLYKLDERIHAVNKNYMAGNYGYVKQQANGKFDIKTPATDHNQSKYISTILNNEGEVSILQVLREADSAARFANTITNTTVKGVSRTIAPEVVYASIIGMGCNIGPNRMRQRISGMAKPKLKSFIDSHFSEANLVAANDALVQAIEGLNLPNIYRMDDDRIYSSSDGKKIPVAVDSLLANQSYKYFGNGRGVILNSFINEKSALFFTDVVNSTDREGVYLLDGISHNFSEKDYKTKNAAYSKKGKHATDTHGYTDAVFAGMHFHGMIFAPRIANSGEASIFSLKSRAHYKNLDYRILPTRPINRALILEKWDDMLRFIATIKLGKTSASQLYRILNSGSKEQTKAHPLYKALQEFGRIFKSIHLLDFYDDTEFRQKLNKELNRVELANKFSGAVFWDRGKELHVGAPEEQRIYMIAKSIIQNSIILFNYLFLSERVMETKDPELAQDMLDSIQTGSVICWSHVNLSGTYDFSSKKREFKFSYEKLKNLQMANTG